MPHTNRNYILFDDYQCDHLLPLIFIRPVGELRIGILTIKEKWERWTGQSFSYHTRDYLKEKFPLVTGDENLLINGSVTPNNNLVEEILSLRCGEALVSGPVLLAACIDRPTLSEFDGLLPSGLKEKTTMSDFHHITRPWHLFRMNGDELHADFKLVTSKRESAKPGITNNLIRPSDIFLEDGAQLEYVTLNASHGPIYIGKNATIMEGSVIRGPLALCEGAMVKMGTRIYGPTTIGPFSKAGGEITNSVIMGFSNKVHDGYMGNSVIGEWCNIGAGTNTSNLKNTLAPVTVWDYSTGMEEETGLLFCGLIMGDYSRCGINTMFNTGSVVGISANVFGSGYPGSFIPSFSWGGATGFETYRKEKAIETIKAGMTLRGQVFTETDYKIMTHLYTVTGRYRKQV